MRLLREDEIRRALLRANPNISDYHRHTYATAVVALEAATEAPEVETVPVEPVTAEDIRTAIAATDIRNVVVIQLAASAVVKLLKSRGVPT